MNKLKMSLTALAFVLAICGSFVTKANAAKADRECPPAGCTTSNPTFCCTSGGTDYFRQ